MVKGLDTFQKYFADYEEQYVLIGGAALFIPRRLRSRMRMAAM